MLPSVVLLVAFRFVVLLHELIVSPDTLAVTELFTMSTVCTLEQLPLLTVQLNWFVFAAKPVTVTGLVVVVVIEPLPLTSFHSPVPYVGDEA